eukprot:1599968-Prymnesium_polylepis.1
MARARPVRAWRLTRQEGSGRRGAAKASRRAGTRARAARRVARDARGAVRPLADGCARRQARRRRVGEGVGGRACDALCAGRARALRRRAGRSNLGRELAVRRSHGESAARGQRAHETKRWTWRRRPLCVCVGRAAGVTVLQDSWQRWHVSGRLALPPAHVKPASTRSQLALQPSPATTLPSSHVSLPARSPSPHTVAPVHLSLIHISEPTRRS